MTTRTLSKSHAAKAANWSSRDGSTLARSRSASTNSCSCANDGLESSSDSASRQPAVRLHASSWLGSSAQAGTEARRAAKDSTPPRYHGKARVSGKRLQESLSVAEARLEVYEADAGMDGDLNSDLTALSS